MCNAYRPFGTGPKPLGGIQKLHGLYIRFETTILVFKCDSFEAAHIFNQIILIVTNICCNCCKNCIEEKNTPGIVEMCNSQTINACIAQYFRIFTKITVITDRSL